jgi:transcriptional regulator with XRE-family HTH domain
MTEKLDPAIIEAEENFLIDVQFLLQEVMTRNGVTLSQLAERAGVSKSRISQVMSPDANPTAKTFARLFHALGEELLVSVRERGGGLKGLDSDDGNNLSPQWEWTIAPDVAAKTGDADFVAVLKEAAKESFASNDNHKSVVVMEADVMTTLEAA